MKFTSTFQKDDQVFLVFRSSDTKFCPHCHHHLKSGEWSYVPFTVLEVHCGDGQQGLYEVYYPKEQLYAMSPPFRKEVVVGTQKEAKQLIAKKNQEGEKK